MPIGSGAGGGGASSGAVRAGGAFVELFAKDNISKTLTRVEAKLAVFGRVVNRLGSSALRAGSLLLAPVAALFAGTIDKASQGVFGPQAQAQAQAFTNAWGRAILSLQEGLLPVLEILVPIMENFAAMARQNPQIVLIIAGVAAGLLALGVAAKVAAAAIAIASLAIGAIKIAVLALTSPVWLAVGAIIALVAAFADWGGLFGKLKDAGEKAIGGVIAAFRSGQLELAGEIALAGLKLAWHDAIEWMKNQLNELIDALGGIAKMIVVIKAAQVGAGLGSFFGPIGTIIGGAAGAGAGALAIQAVDDAVRKLIKPSDPAIRAGLAASLAELLKKVNAAAPAGLRIQAPEAARGLFSSPDFKRALGFGEGVKVQERIAAAADKQVALLESIDGKVGRGAAFA